MKWKKWRGGEPSKQKKNCGRHDSTHSHRRNTTFSRVFLRFFFFLALVELARALRSAFNILYLCVDNTEHTYTHTFQSWSIKLSYTMRLGWFARNLCNKCEQKNDARAAPSTFAQLTMRTSTTTTSAILIYCVCDHHAFIPVETHINLSGGAMTTHTKLSSNIHFICNQKILFLLESSECMRNW